MKDNITKHNKANKKETFCDAILKIKEMEGKQ